MSDFNLNIALSLMGSEDPFPVDLDDAWKWIGYSQKQKAKDKLFRNFQEGIDFIVITQMGEPDNHADLSPQEKGVASTKCKVFLSIDCFKMLSMMAGTERGREVRLYFLECEKIAKEKQSSIVVTKGELKEMLTEMAENLFASRLQKIEKYEEVCRNHHGSGYVIQSDVEDKEEPLEEIRFQEYCYRKGLDKRLWNKASRRYGSFAFVGKGVELPRIKGRLAVRQGYYKYADAAIAHVMEYI